MSESDESGVLHERFSRFTLNSDDLIVPSDAGYGRILPKDSQRHSLSSHSVVLPNYSHYEETDKSITRSLPGSNLSSPGRGSYGKPYRPVGAIESFLVEPSHPPLPQKNSQSSEHKIYERGQIIAANRFATPRPVETIISAHNENDLQRLNGDKYYQQSSQTKQSPRHEPDLKRHNSDRYSSGSYLKESPTQSLSGKVSKAVIIINLFHHNIISFHNVCE